MSIAQLYHSSVFLGNTKVFAASDLLALMDETIGQRLKRLRKSKNLTQKELARLCGIAQATIGNIEKETRGYGLSLIAIAKILETTPEYLQITKIHKVREASDDWPFASFSKNQFQKLDAGLREEVEDRLLGAITRQEKTGTHR
jgi:transcriptional regulator with XRE-family HTH domain